MYEQSLHAPLIVRYPGEIAPGSTNDDMVQNIDFAPTLLDYAGVEIPGNMHGRSFRPILQGRRPPGWRDKVYYHYYEGYDIPEQYGIRTKTHKLICYPAFDNGQYWELFDLINDPSELNNVYSEPAYSQIVDALKIDLENLRKKYGDTDESRGPKRKCEEIDHLAKGCPVSLKHPPSPRYAGGSPSPLTDGIVNNISPRWAFYYERWLGFEGDDLDATIDLQRPVTVSRISARFLQKLDSWIFPPTDVRIEVSAHGSDFTGIEVSREVIRAEGGVAFLHVANGRVGKKSIRFIRLHAKNRALCPDWHPGAGKKAWLFVDEAVVE